MSVNIPGHFSTQFATNIQLLLQQRPSKLEPYVTKGFHKGEAASPVDQLGAVEMQEVTSRFAPMGRVDVGNDRRWVYPHDFDLPQLIDTFDLLRTVTDPKSLYVQNAISASNRTKDTTILNGVLGDNKTGKAGATVTPFRSANQIAVNYGAASNTGLTVPKLRQAKKLLMEQEVDVETEKLVCVVTAAQHDNLLAEAQIISLDFNDRPVLMEGKITRFLGFDFVHSERVPVDSNGYRRVPVWAKSAVYLGLWNDVETSISTRNDLQGEPWQVYAKMSLGATRLEEKKVVEIKCA